MRSVPLRSSALTGRSDEACPWLKRRRQARLGEVCPSLGCLVVRMMQGGQEGGSDVATQPDPCQALREKTWPASPKHPIG